MFLLVLLVLVVFIVEYCQVFQSIDVFFKVKGKEFYGIVIDQGCFQVGWNVVIIEVNFGQVIFENSMKWESFNFCQGQYNWGQVDYFVNWVIECNKIICGYIFVWYFQFVGWVNQINNCDQFMCVIQEYICIVGGCYKGKIYYWVCYVL